MVPELRPRGIGEILDAAVSLYRARFKPLMVVTLFVVVPVQVLSTLVLLSAQPDDFNIDISGQTTPQFNSATIQLGATVIVLLVSTLSTAFIVAVCTRIVADAYIQHLAPAADAVRVAGRRFFAVIGVSIIVALAQIVGMFAACIGYFVALALFAVAIPALLLEGISVGKSISRSWTLVASNFWRSLGLVLTAQVLGTIVTTGLAAGIAIFLPEGNDSAGVIAQGVANTVSSVLTTPFLAAATVVLYFDLRIRREAFDVQLLMQNTDAGVATA